MEDLEKEIADLEADIAQKEALLASGGAEAADAAFYADYQSLKDSLDARMSAWEEATIALVEFEQS